MTNAFMDREFQDRVKLLEKKLKAQLNRMRGVDTLAETVRKKLDGDPRNGVTEGRPLHDRIETAVLRRGWVSPVFMQYKRIDLTNHLAALSIAKNIQSLVDYLQTSPYEDRKVFVSLEKMRVGLTGILSTARLSQLTVEVLARLRLMNPAHAQRQKGTRKRRSGRNKWETRTPPQKKADQDIYKQYHHYKAYVGGSVADFRNELNPGPDLTLKELQQIFARCRQWKRRYLKRARAELKTN